jgi:NifU-like protein involved in Fe-S cluster formation
MNHRSARYSDAVLDLFDALPRAGALQEGAGLPVTGEAVALDRGAWVRFDARVDQGRIVACCFRSWGCPHVLAAAARTAQRLDGLAVGGDDSFDARALLQALGAPTEKLGRLLVVEDAGRRLLAAARAVQSA